MRISAPICVAGMHRSGTSMVARVLHQCGMYLGPDSDLAPAKPDNPDGFWENVNFVDLNEEIFAHLGGGWDLPPPSFPSGWQGDEEFQKLRVKAELLVSRFRGRDPWGWKDPRNSVTIPFWKSVLPNMKVILCVRHPLEVALSLRSRNFLSYELSLTLWALYNRRALEDVPSHERLVVHYDAFFSRPEAEVRRIVQFTGLDVHPAQLESAVTRIRPDLRHSTFETRHLLDAGLSAETVRLYLTLLSEAGWREGLRELSPSQRTEPRVLDNGNGGEIVQHDVPFMPSAGKLNRSNFELELLRRQTATARAELERRATRIAELENRISELSNPGDIDSTVKPPDSGMEELKNVLRDIERTLTSTQSFVERYVDAFTDLENLLPPEDGETPTADIETRRAALHQRIEHVLNVLEASRNDAASMRHGFENMSALATQAEQDRAAMHKATAEMTASLEEANARAAALQRDRDEHRRIAENASAQLEKLTRRVASAEHQLQEMAQAAAAKDRDLESMTARAVAAERERDSARASVESARGLMMNLYREIESIHQSRLWKVGSAYWSVLRWMGRLPPSSEAAATTPSFQPFDVPVPVAAEPATAPTAEEPPVRKKRRRMFDPKRAARYVKQALTPKPDAHLTAELEQIADEHARRFSQRPTILDWNSGANAPALLPREVVFVPSVASPTLPYLDKTVDIVIVRGSRRTADTEAEAERVARHAVVTLTARQGIRFGVRWLRVSEQSPLCASIIVPVYNHIADTETCLDALQQTLPPGFCGEIIVVDDASTDETPARLATRAAADPRIRVLRNERNCGFIDSCNRAAQAAEHDYLVFVNNDTIAQPQWLSSLLETFARHPQAGAVGGKLLYPDGRLQEAGGALFADATGLNFGKFDRDPAAPLYNFVREVDYCSGALLATPRKLFNEIGGFDTRYRPAYYEDADYCFEVRAHGRDVLYQPESALVHVEGVTHGTDLASGIKKYQVTNRETFRAKWASELETRPLPPREYDRGTLQRLAWPADRKRMLFINHTVPEYDREGGSRRLFHLIEFACDAGWAVTFMAPWVPWGERYERELQQLGVQTFRKGLATLDDDPHYETEADRLIATGGFDVACISFWHIAETWMPKIRALSPKTKIVIDSIDLHFLRQARAALREPSAGGTLTTGYADEMRREMNVYASSDGVLTVSEKEAGIINDFTSNSRLAFPVPETEPPFPNVRPFEERNGILFIGSFRHPPNIEAVTFLAEKIVPHLDPALLREHPLYIVGNGLDATIEKICAGIPNVRLVGWVPTLDDYLRHARISVLPLLNGAGTKTKLIQALNAGTPSVSTRIGAEGLPIAHGEHVLIADDPAEFARHIAALLTDRELWKRLADAGRQTIERTHGRAAGKVQFSSVLDRIIAQ